MAEIFEYQFNKKHKLTRRAGANQRGKVCWGKCGERLTFKSFSKNRAKPDGLKEYCKDCANAYRRDRIEQVRVSGERYERTSKRRPQGRFRFYGWPGRLRELRETGQVTALGRGAALKLWATKRLVWGELRFVEKKRART